MAGHPQAKIHVCGDPKQISVFPLDTYQVPAACILEPSVLNLQIARKRPVNRLEVTYRFPPMYFEFVRKIFLSWTSSMWPNRSRPSPGS